MAVQLLGGSGPFVRLLPGENLPPEDIFHQEATIIMDAWDLIETRKDQLVADTAAFLRIPSLRADPQPGMPYGPGIAQALDYFLNLAKEMGFAVKNGDGHYGAVDFGNSEEYVAVLAHLDVVPTGSGWDRDPFGGIVEDGRLYGRGAIDDKGPAMAVLHAMKALKDSGFVPAKRIRLVVGCDEEMDWGCMAHYTACESLPLCGFTPDANYPLIYAEKGISSFRLLGERQESSPLFQLVSLQGGEAVNVVCSLCQAVLRPAEGQRVTLLTAVQEEMERFGEMAQVEERDGLLQLTVQGIPAHGSTPEKGKNAASALMEILGGLYRRSGGYSALVDFYNNTLQGETEGRGLGIAFQDEASGSLSCNVGIIRAAYDQSPQEEIRIDVRSPVTMPYEELCRRLGETCARYHRRWELLSHKDPICTDPNSPLAQTLMAVYREETGCMDSQPIAIGGGTYARAMPNIVAFGPLFEGEEELAHQKNEFISLDSLVKNCRIAAKALMRLAQ